MARVVALQLLERAASHSLVKGSSHSSSLQQLHRHGSPHIQLPAVKYESSLCSCEKGLCLELLHQDVQLAEMRILGVVYGRFEVPRRNGFQSPNTLSKI